jgi:hypothetical protein
MAAAVAESPLTPGPGISPGRHDVPRITCLPPASTTEELIEQINAEV